MQDGQIRLLRFGFLVGAITDALAIMPMLYSPLARAVMGIEGEGGAYHFAIRYAASLMLGWTALLLWAYRKPIERRFVAMLTVVVILGLVATEVASAVAGDLAAARLVSTWCIQTVLVSLFLAGYYYPALRRNRS